MAEKEQQQLNEKALEYGQRVKERRKALGLSQHVAAAKAGMHQSMWWRAESGRNILRGDTLRRVAALLDVQPEEIGDTSLSMRERIMQNPEGREVWKAYGQRVKAQREALGLTQETISEIIGVSETAYGSWERGACFPAEDNMARIQENLGVSLGTEEIGPYGGAVAELLKKRSREAEARAEAAAEREAYGRRLQQQREAQGITRWKAFQLTGIPYTTLKNIEDGVYWPSEERAAEIRKFFGVSMDTEEISPISEEAQELLQRARQEAAQAGGAGSSTRAASKEFKACAAATADSADSAAKAAAAQRSRPLQERDAQDMTKEERRYFVCRYAAHLKQARELAGLSLVEAGKALGVHWASVSGWERGKQIPRMAQRQKIEEELGVKNPTEEDVQNQPTAANPELIVLPSQQLQPAKSRQREPEKASTLLDYTCIMASRAGMFYGQYVATVGEAEIKKGWNKIQAERRRKHHADT